MSLDDCKKDFVRKVVCDWYGMPTMPMTILSREEEIERFEKQHPEIPPFLWEFINHRTRQAFLWVRRDDVDIVVKDTKHGQSQYRMIQDMIFRGNYEKDIEWKAVVMEIAAHWEEIWVVFHDEVCPE